jgi:hypothetical protein
VGESVCSLVVLNSVTSTPQWIRQPEPRDTHHVCALLCVCLCSLIASFVTRPPGVYCSQHTLRFPGPLFRGSTYFNLFFLWVAQRFETNLPVSSSSTTSSSTDSRFELPVNTHLSTPTCFFLSSVEFFSRGQKFSVLFPPPPTRRRRAVAPSVHLVL